MKKAVRFFLAGAAGILLCACGSGEKAAEEKSLYDQGLEVVELMSEIAGSDTYLELTAGSEELQKRIQDMAVGDDTTPDKVYAITISEDSFAETAELAGLADMSPELTEFLEKRMLGAVISQINAGSGVENLAAVSLCAAGKTFVNSGITQDQIYLYTFADTMPAAVTFTVGEDQTVNASGMFVSFEGFDCESADTIRSFFRTRNMDADVEEIPVKQ